MTWTCEVCGEVYDGPPAPHFVCEPCIEGAEPVGDDVESDEN